MPGKSGAGRVFARRPSCAPNSRLARKLQNPLGRIAVTKANRGSAGYSPDRVDALVWAFTELLVERMPSYAAYEIAREQAEAVIAQRRAEEEARRPKLTPAKGSVEYMELLKALNRPP